MKFSQKDKQKRGMDFESEFRMSCNYIICYVHKMINYGYGTPFDYSMTVNGGAIALELKRTLKNTLGFSAITENEINGLNAFESRVSTNTSFVLCNIKNADENRTFLIPWSSISLSVVSGKRGSIRVTEFEEIKRIKLPNDKYGWDLSPLEGLYESNN